MESALQIVEAIYRLVATAAIIVGGGWAYMKFVKGRTFRRRMKVSIEGQIEPGTDSVRLLVKPQAENVGLREVKISSEVTSIELHSAVLSSSEAVADEMRWDSVGVWQVFGEQELLEPGESVEDPLLLEITPGGYDAMKIELTVSIEATERSWRTTEVVILDPGADNKSEEVNA